MSARLRDQLKWHRVERTSQSLDCGTQTEVKMIPIGWRKKKKKSRSCLRDINNILSLAIVIFKARVGETIECESGVAEVKPTQSE